MRGRRSGPRAWTRRGEDQPLSPLIRRAVRRITEAPLVGGNSAQLLVDGPRAYPAMLEMIAAAKERVHLENYIMRADGTGRRFAEALAERAAAGVEVRVLYDWFGCFRTPKSFWQELRRSGCEVRSFGAPSLRRPILGLWRNHRKLLVTDGRAAVVGGLCIGDEWAGNGDVACWRDTAIRLEGPIARNLDQCFIRMWRLVDGHLDTPLEAPAHSPEPGKVVARVVDGPPAHARAYRLYQLIAALAERTLYITGAYPLAPASLRSALAAAARNGVDVRLLAPSQSDLPLLNQAARAHYASLLTAGVRIYEWDGPMLHAKTVATDGKIALIGSSNLNPVSLLGCYELDVEVEDPTLAATLEQQFLRDIDGAREITLETWIRRSRAQRWGERLGAAAVWLPYRFYSG